MKRSRFADLSDEERDWIDACLDGTITAEEFDALQERMLANAGLRKVMRLYLSVHSALQNESEVPDAATSPWLGNALPETPRSPFRVSRFLPMAAAAALAFLLGSGIMYWSSFPSKSGIADPTAEEPVAEGFAVIGQLFDADWPDGGSPRSAGDTLGAEAFHLASGAAEIQFFSGATMTVEGPAEIVLKSAWEATCREGAVRMRVPPAARGFTLHGPSTEIVDLGTEFGLVVREGRGHVEVFDGEIALQHRNEDERILTEGSALVLAPDGPSAEETGAQIAYPDAQQFGSRAEEQQRAGFQRWKSHRDALARDARLIAYYTFERGAGESLIPNLAVPRNTELDGAVILAETVDGRWPDMESLEFRRPGARVRVNIPGEFSAFTFVCWVRIDSLDRQYNALFMGDGYETGEPHWQIDRKGRMMLSVMIDDQGRHPVYPKRSRYHHVYFSPPMWELSMSGQWLHLASVFDPEDRAVSHYVNGKRISREEIDPLFMIEALRIGNGEIGNWGQPFREDPKFAIRNLNGRMDEIAILDAALGDGEIAEVFEGSRSGRH